MKNNNLSKDELISKIETLERLDVLKNKLFDSITLLHTEFLKKGIHYGWCDKILENLLYLTNSEFGFICELFYKEDGTPYIKSHGISNISWNEETRKFYEANIDKGLEFFNFKSIWGHAITSGENYISNNPDTDPHKGGYPKDQGHPPLKSFIGLPVKNSNGKVIGIMGVANNPNGYDKKLIDLLSPFVHTYGMLIEKDRLDKQEKISKEKILESKRIATESENKFRNLFNSMQEGFYLHQMIYDKNGNATNYRIIEANDISEKYLNIKKKDALGKLATELFGTKEAPFLEVYSKVAETGEPNTFERYFEPMDKHFLISAFSPKKGYFATVFLDITKNKEAELALRESEEKYSALINTANEAIGVAQEGVFKFINKEMSVMLGLPKDEIIGKPFIDFICPDDREMVMANYKRRIAGEKVPVNYDFRIIDAQKNLKWVLISANKMQWDGKPATINLLTDITERKNIERELIKAKEKAEENEDKFKLLNRLTSEMLLLQDMESNYKFIAENLQKHYPNTVVLTVSIDESIEQTKLEAISGLHKSLLVKATEISGFNPIGKMYKLTDLHKNYLKSGNLTEFNGGLAKFSASEFPALAANAIEKLIGLHKIYSIGINKDDELLAAVHFFTYNKQEITDGEFIELFVKQAGLVLQTKINEKVLNTAREKAEEKQANITAIIEGTDNSIWAFNRKYEILYINQKMQKDFLETFGELLEPGMNLVKALPKPFQPLWKPRYDRVLNNEKFTIEDAVPADNGTLYIEVTFNPIIKNGEVIGASCFGSNITSRKNGEIELVKAKEKAEESDRLKSAFLANMSHEIRTPMNGILGFTNLLKEQDLTGEDQQKFIEIIETSGERMLTTVNDIIDISKIEAGQVDVIISDINLNKQMDELFEFFLPEAKKKNLQLSITSRLPNQQANFQTDKEKLNSILTNLIKNAIKYTQEGNIEFGFTIMEKAKQDALKFYVKDTGIGVPKDRQNAIFNRFEQADIEDRQVFEGSGLGLAISKAYVKMLGGEIWVESKVGVGSQFYFTIPYKTNGKNTSNKITKDSTIQFQTKNDLKILIADDDEFVITFLQIILDKCAKEMLVAKNGNDAVEMFRRNPDIDVILMDIKIPGIDGYEATRQIRALNKEVFILAQTAYAQTGDREACIQAGCDDYISKPIDKERLVEIITNHFQISK